MKFRTRNFIRIGRKVGVNLFDILFETSQKNASTVKQLRSFLFSTWYERKGILDQADKFDRVKSKSNCADYGVLDLQYTDWKE